VGPFFELLVGPLFSPQLDGSLTQASHDGPPLIRKIEKKIIRIEKALD
jgi:hypothetical protein